MTSAQKGRLKESYPSPSLSPPPLPPPPHSPLPLSHLPLTPRKWATSLLFKNWWIENWTWFVFDKSYLHFSYRNVSCILQKGGVKRFSGVFTQQKKQNMVLNWDAKEQVNQIFLEEKRKSVYQKRKRNIIRVEAQNYTKRSFCIFLWLLKLFVNFNIHINACWNRWYLYYF